MSTLDMAEKEREISMITFVALHLAGGHVLIPLMLLTLLCWRKITRNAIFVNFCITWMLYSLSYLLLFYSGELKNPHPKFSLCVTQAAMNYSAAPMTSVSSLIYVLHILITLRRAIYQYPPYKFQGLLRAIMIITPYIVFITVFTVVIILGLRNPQQIFRDANYCRSVLPSIERIPPGISCVAGVGCIITEIMIAFTLHHHWRAFREIGAETGLTLHFMIRGMVFTLFVTIAVLACGAFLAAFKRSIADFVIALLPMAVFLVFGTQSDLVRAWCASDREAV